MSKIDNPLKWIMCVGLVAVLAGCGEDQDTATAPESTDESATMPEPAAPATEEPAADEAEPADTAAGAGEQAAGGGGAAERHTVIARATAFDPVVIRIKPGDTVSWTNMSGHNVHFEAGNIPEGAEPYQSPLGDDVSHTFDIEGVYLYKCDPHFAMGMVGAIVVGEPVNLEQVKQNAQGMYKRALAKLDSQ